MECEICGKKLAYNNRYGVCKEHRLLSTKFIEAQKERERKRYLSGRKEYIYSYREKHKQELNKRRREHRKENLEKYRECDRKRDRSDYLKYRYDNDPMFNLRSKLSSSFKNWYKNKSESTFENFSKENYFYLLKKRFYIDFPDLIFEECLLSGEWHIDHIIPVSFAKNSDDLKKLYQPRNLRLIKASENLYKQNKILKEEIMKYDLEDLLIEIGGYHG